jgi:hypothetical protein
MFYLFPTKFVFWTQIDNHKEIKNKYYDKLVSHIDSNENRYKEKIQKTWGCECASSFFDANAINSLFDEEFYKEIIWNPIDLMLSEMTDKLNIPCPQTSTLEGIWYNKYSRGNWQEVHNHLPTTYSGIYLFHLEEKNTTTFFDTGNLKCWGDENNMPRFLTSNPDANIDEGTVIIFPSELMHYVNPCEKEKISISFNVQSQFTKRQDSSSL